jgi:hypothetical protein
MGRTVPLCTAGLKVELPLIKNAFCCNGRQHGCRCAPIRLGLRTEATFASLTFKERVSQDQPGGIMRLGNTKVLVSLNHGSPAGVIDHFAIGIPRFSRESVARYLMQRGAIPLEGDYAGLHVKDPDGINVQISQK